MENKEIKLGTYEVTGFALHSESLKEFVLYKHVIGKRKGEENFWVRPVEMFLEKVEVNGKKVKRFEYVGE